MDKYETLANEIIESISDVIEENYGITPKAFDEKDGLENPDLINGIVYYKLEEEIAEKIREMVFEERGKVREPLETKQ